MLSARSAPGTSALHFQRHTNDLEELAFDLLNLAWSDAMAEDIVPQLIEVKTVGLGEPDYIEEDLRGMRAYWQGKGGQILSDILRYERAQMPREEMVSAIDFHQDEIATNFWGTFDKLTSPEPGEAAAASGDAARRTRPGVDHRRRDLRLLRRSDAHRRSGGLGSR